MACGFVDPQELRYAVSITIARLLDEVGEVDPETFKASVRRDSLGYVLTMTVEEGEDR